LEKNEAVVLARPVSDTIKRIPANGEIEEITLEDLERQRLWAMETPQAFEFAALKNAYIKANDEALNFTDDAAVASHSGIKITLIPNPKPNPKLTEVEDFAWIEHLLAQD
jgi:2-C-methyl-D-erythritol 4-phosphate cytidylyltransferase